MTLRELKHLFLMNCAALRERLKAVSYFLQAFHIVNSELYFGIRGSRNLSHAQTLISPSENSQLFSATVAQIYAMKGQWKDSRQDQVWKQCWKTYCIVL